MFFLPPPWLALEQHVASTFPSPEELRAMTPDEARELLDLDEQESIEDAIRDVEEWMASDDYEDFDVDDDIYLAVHPNAVLDAIVVFPDNEADEPESYPYQTAIADAEKNEDKDGEFKGVDSLDLDEDDLDDNNEKKNIRWKFELIHLCHFRERVNLSREYIQQLW